MKLKEIVVFGVFAFSAMLLNAEKWKDLETGIIWHYSEDSNGGLSITGTTNARGEVIVPSIIDDKNVVSIGYHAFKENSSISKLIISKGILSTGPAAFHGSYVNEVIFPEGLESIGGGAFRYCYSLQKVVMPNSIKNIGSGAFHDCKALKELVLPTGLKTINPETFLNCESLENLVIPNSVAQVKVSDPYPDPFQGCNSLVRMTVPECLCRYGSQIPSSVTNIVFADGVKSIGGRAFENHSRLKSIGLPSSLESIGGYAFAWCQIEFVSFPKGLKDIGVCAFRGNPLKVVDIPDSVTNIMENAFQGCTNLSDVSLPNNIDRVALNAFEDTPIGFKIQSKLVKMSLGQDNNGNVGNASYLLLDSVDNRSIANVKVDNDMAIDSFVLKDGKVFDCALRIVNTSDDVVTVSLPRGYVYEKFINTNPLEIPALSTNILTITRTDEKTFLISREKLMLEQ